MAVSWSIQTPAGTRGAVAVVQVAAASAEELDEALRRVGVGPIGVGAVALRNLAGVDRGIVARWSETSVHLMPHGGPAVLRALAAALTERGLQAGDPDARTRYPEAVSEVEAAMLAALARAVSPLAVELLLDQPRRWSAPSAASDPTRDRILNRLIDPPLVVAVGPPNIGKSSLVNTLAGRAVALVADEPGTTRDHVGVLIDAAGLVLRYIDTPGIRADAGQIEAEAAEIARGVAAAADLVLVCGDAGAPPVALPAGPDVLHVALRCDLGRPAWPHDVEVSALTGAGLADLVQMLRERLVPAAAVEHPGPWRFW